MSNQVNRPDRTDLLFEELAAAVRATSDGRISEILHAIVEEGRNVFLNVDQKAASRPETEFALSADDARILRTMGIEL